LHANTVGSEKQEIYLDDDDPLDDYLEAMKKKMIKS
jgi:hypothetical protein